MKAYKVTCLVVDHDGLGADGTKSAIECASYGNHWGPPRVMDVEERDIGEWHDGHPLNINHKSREEFERLFKPEDDRQGGAE